MWQEYYRVYLAKIPYRILAWDFCHGSALIILKILQTAFRITKVILWLYHLPNLSEIPKEIIIQMTNTAYNFPVYKICQTVRYFPLHTACGHSDTFINHTRIVPHPTSISKHISDSHLSPILHPIFPCVVPKMASLIKHYHLMFCNLFRSHGL